MCRKLKQLLFSNEWRIFNRIMFFILENPSRLLLVKLLLHMSKLRLCIGVCFFKLMLNRSFVLNNI